MSNNNNKREKSRNNSILARLLFRTPEQLKQYCELLGNEKTQDLYKKVLEEMRKNQEINQVKKLNEIAAIIEDCYKDEGKREESYQPTRPTKS